MQKFVPRQHVSALESDSFFAITPGSDSCLGSDDAWEDAIRQPVRRLETLWDRLGLQDEELLLELRPHNCACSLRPPIMDRGGFGAVVPSASADTSTPLLF